MDSEKCGDLSQAQENPDTILVVGFCCFDLIFTAPHFPTEDSTIRALEYHKQRGGNASNSCTVLTQLGEKCELFANLTTDEYGEFIQNDLTENGILFHNCPKYSNFNTPFTNIILSLSSATRTLLHYRHVDFPDNKASDFSKLNFSAYKWIHFEGRGIGETLKMIDKLDEWNAMNRERRITYSVELEKGANVTKELIPRGDVVFVGKDFAKFLGYQNPCAALQGLASRVKPGAIIIVPWGEEGASARSADGNIIVSSACPPDSVLDTTGAGDTFIAATIFYLSKNKSLLETVNFANQIAGAKCGMVGFQGINAVYENIQKG